MPRPPIRRVLGILSFLLLPAGCAEPQPLQVSDARIRAAIPGQDRTAAYFTARNTSDREIVLVGAAGGPARAIEMHTTVGDGGVARMRRLEEVVVPAGKTVRFEPGGRHLMLFGVPDLDEAVEITLEIRDGRQISARFETIPIGGR